MLNFDGAIADYTQVIRLMPSTAEAFAKRGNALLHKAMDSDNLPEEAKDEKGIADYANKAIADLTEAIRLDPNDIESRCNRASAYETKGDFDKAIADENHVLHENSGFVRGYYLRGLAYEKKGEHDKAIKDENIAIRLEPNDAEAYYVRAKAYEKKGEKAKAAADRAMVEKLRREGPLRP